MKSKLIFSLIGTLCAVCSAGNLIKNSDFSLYPNRVGSEYQQISAWKNSRIELFTENLSWNKCGKLAVLDFYPSSAKGHKAASASVVIGVDGKNPGFKCKPDTVYRYSVQVRGSATRTFVRGMEWSKGGKLWDFKECKKSKKAFPVSKEWTTISGTFKTGSTAERAAFNISIWWDSQYKNDKNVLKAGDFLLIDNVKVTEEKPLWEEKQAPAAAKISVVKSAPLMLNKKSVSWNDPSWNNVPATKDFLLLTSKNKKVMNADVSFKAQSDGKNIYMLVNCNEPEKVARDSSRDLWYNDVIELFFAEPGSQTGFVQIAAGACGRSYIARSNGTTPVSGVKIQVKASEKSWSAFFTIPVKTVYSGGLPGPGSRLGFNIAVKRTNAKEYYSWNKVKTLRTVSQFGVLVVNGYGKGITRSVYEKKFADAAAAEQQRKFAAFKESKTAVGVLSVTSDYSVPMSAGVVEPVNSISIKGAVNEIVALPVAVANLDSKATEFRVTLEAGDVSVFNGSYGLKNYPAGNITTRTAIRTRDSANCAGELFDPLPGINEASTILIPGRECGVVWFDFNTAGVKPGVYSGVLRVTPLNKKGNFAARKGGSYHRRIYKGTRLEIPVKFEVRNIVLDTRSAIPSQFFASNVEDNEKLFAAGLELGSEGYAISPWGLRFPLQKDGTFQPKADEAKKRLEQLKKLSKKYNVPFRFQIVYSAYPIFVNMYSLKKKPEEAKKLWPRWIEALKAFMTANDIKPEQFVIEIFDEPGDIEEVIRVVNAAHKVWPELRNMVTLDSRAGKEGGNYKNRVRAAAMRRMKDAVDTWVLHRHYYFTDPEHLAFYREIRAEGKKVGHYTCETNPTSQLYGNHRLFAWFGVQYDLDVNNMYQLAAFINYNGGVDFASATAGNLLLISGYRGNVIPTIRSMALRQGIMDVKYLALLRKKFGKLPEVQNFIKKSVQKVMIDRRYDPAAADQVKEEAAQLLLKLQKKQ